MPRLCSLASAVPHHPVDQPLAKAFCRRHFAGHLTELEHLLPLFDRAGVARRYLCCPPQWYTAPRSFEEANQIFLQEATRLATTAASCTLEHVGLEPVDVDAYGVASDRFRFAAETLHDYGNLSSATVLLVLERCLREQALAPAAYAVASALGPGFCSESVLLRNGS